MALLYWNTCSLYDFQGISKQTSKQALLLNNVILIQAPLRNRWKWYLSYWVTADDWNGQYLPQNIGGQACEVGWCMCGFLFISALECSYLCLACSLLGLLLPAFLGLCWMEKEAQTPFSELSCRPGQFRDVLTNLGPPWEMQPVPAFPGVCALCLSQIGTMAEFGLWMPGNWWADGAGEALAGLYPMLRRHHKILEHSVLISQPTSVPISSPILISSPGREDTSPPPCRYLLAPSYVLKHVEQSCKNLRSCLVSKTGLQNIWLSSMCKAGDNQVSSVIEYYFPESALTKVISGIFFLAFNLFVVWSVELALNVFIM